jgi:hypothetical protein
MWLIHIDQKGWLLLARSRLLIAINRHRRRRSFLQHDVGRHHRVDDVVIPRSSLAPAMQCKVWLTFVVSSFAPSRYDVKNVVVVVAVSRYNMKNTLVVVVASRDRQFAYRDG